MQYQKVGIGGMLAILGAEIEKIENILKENKDNFNIQLQMTILMVKLLLVEN